MLTGALEGPRRAAVIGHPVAHSLSPAIHRHAYRQLGLDWRYDAVDVAPGELDAFMASLDERWVGLSVTMPHKPGLVAHGEPDEVVRLTGVANTWVRRGDAAIVRNTDVSGFVLGCRASGLDAVHRATVVGTGSTARSAVVAMRQLGATHIEVVGRDLGRAEAVCSLAAPLGCAMTASVLPGSGEVDLVVSTIPADAVAPHAQGLVARSHAVFDAIYDPWPTTLASVALAAGRPVLNGLDLLAAQATFQVALMTGREIDVAHLRAAADAGLRDRESVSD